MSLSMSMRSMVCRYLNTRRPVFLGYSGTKSAYSEQCHYSSKNIPVPELPADFPTIPPRRTWSSVFFTDYKDIIAEKSETSGRSKFVTGFEIWGSLPEEEKQRYKEKRIKLKEERDMVIKSLTAEQLEIFNNFNLAERKAKEEKRLRQIKKNILPKNPANAFGFYLKRENKGAAAMDLKTAYSKFRELPEYEKEAFEEMAVKDRERYHSEMVELLRRLKATDRTHLVSSKVLKKYST